MRRVGGSFFYTSPTYSSQEWFEGIENPNLRILLKSQVEVAALMMEPHDPLTGQHLRSDPFHYLNGRDGLITGLRVVTDVYGDTIDHASVLGGVVGAHQELMQDPNMQNGVRESLTAMGRRGLEQLEPTLFARVMSWEHRVSRERAGRSRIQPRESDSFGIGFGITVLASMVQFDHARLGSILAVSQQEMEQAAQDAKTYDWDGEFPEADPDSRG